LGAGRRETGVTEETEEVGGNKCCWALEGGGKGDRGDRGGRRKKVLLSARRRREGKGGEGDLTI
jgi:hypothetical protein